MATAARGVLLTAAILLLVDLDSSQAQDARLTLKWVDSNQLFDVGAKRVEAEVRTLFHELAVDVEWIEDPQLDSPHHPLELLVLLRPSEPADFGLPPETMGAVFGHRGPKPVIWVFLPSVVRTVLCDRNGATYAMVRVPRSPPSRQKQVRDILRRKARRNRGPVARRIARVVLHEVIHAVAPSMPHAEEGIMREKMLLGPRPLENAGVDADSLEGFRRGLEAFLRGS